MAHFVYILECSDSTLYVGCTSDVELRVAAHQLGRGSIYTAKRLPLKLVFQEQLASQNLALSRERQIKRWNHAKKAALVAGNCETLRSLARSTRTKRRRG